MPISFLEQHQPVEARLKARQLVRELAAHRYGIFKESGFRSDFMYPPYASVAGLDAARAAQQLARWAWANNRSASAEGAPPHANGSLALGADPPAAGASGGASAGASAGASLRGFDQHWQECAFDTAPASGLPASGQAANCAPYLAKLPQAATNAPLSFNLMSADPFSYVDLAPAGRAHHAHQPLPVQWARELAEAAGGVRWHFCGDNFQPGAGAGAEPGAHQPAPAAAWFEHNQRAANKQNKMCQERSALDVIRQSADFRRAPFR